MVIFADFPLTVPTAVVGILLAVTVYKVFAMLSGSGRKQNALPMAPVGLFHAMQQIGGSQAPFFIDEMAKTLDQNCFRLPLPLGPCARNWRLPIGKRHSPRQDDRQAPQNVQEFRGTLQKNDVHGRQP
jgi:hypothetical protein